MTRRHLVGQGADARPGRIAVGGAAMRAVCAAEGMFMSPGHDLAHDNILLFPRGKEFIFIIIIRNLASLSDCDTDSNRAFFFNGRNSAPAVMNCILEVSIVAAIDRRGFDLQRIVISDINRVVFATVIHASAD